MTIKQDVLEFFKEIPGWFIAKDLDDATEGMPRFVPMRASDEPLTLSGKLLANLLAIPYSLVKIAFILLCLVVIGVPFLACYPLGCSLKWILTQFDKTKNNDNSQ